MVDFLNLFIIFITLNYDAFLCNIKATDNNSIKKKTKKILSLANIQEEKYEINAQILYYSPNSTSKEKCVKITEIEYDGIDIRFVDKDSIPMNVKESEFHKIMSGNLKSNDRDYYFEIFSVVFKVTIFIEEKCFHTTLWFNNYLSKPIKISTSLHDQLLELIRILEPDSGYQYIILPLGCFDNTTPSNSICSENKNIYNVDILKAKVLEYVDIYNLTITKNSKTYNVNNFIFSHIYSEVYTKIYCETSDHGRMVEEYIGKSTNQYNIMNEKILFFCTKTDKPQDKNNQKIHRQ